MDSLSEVKMEVAKNITLYRKQRGLTQKEAAVLYGVKANTLCNWEKGNTSIEMDYVMKICAVLQVNFSDLLGKYHVETAKSHPPPTVPPEISKTH